MGGALHNLRRNANDFGYNYSLLLITVSVACVVTKPFSLITIACLLMLWAGTPSRDVHVLLNSPRTFPFNHRCYFGTCHARA
jgi:hypothetical protein